MCFEEVCALRVSARIRNANVGVIAVLQMVAVVAGGHRAQILFWEFLIVRLSWHLGVCWMWRMAMCLGSGRSRQGLDVVFGPRTANWICEAAFDSGISTVINECLVLHVR